MGGPIRRIRVGLQAADNVAPATWYEMKVEVANDPDLRNVREREQIPIHNGTVEGDEEEAGATVHSELNVTTPIYYDTCPIWLVGCLGLPTSAAVPSQAGAYDHTFKRSTTAAPPFLAVQFWDQVDTTWLQALNMIVMSWRVTQDKARSPRLQVTLQGKLATSIAAPTSSLASTANGLAAWNGFRGEVATALSRITRYTLDGNNNRTPQYSGNDTADPDYFMRGLQEASLDATHLLAAYSGSYAEDYDNGDDIADWTARYKNTAVTIGVSTNPTVTISVPKVKFRSFDRPNDGPEKVQHYTAAAGYDSGIASRMSLVVRNTAASYVPD